MERYTNYFIVIAVNYLLKLLTEKLYIKRKIDRKFSDLFFYLALKPLYIVHALCYNIFRKEGKDEFRGYKKVERNL